MNFIDWKKIIKMATVMVSVALFLCGMLLIIFFNSSEATAVSQTGDDVNDLFKPFIQKKEPFNILVLGGDKVAHNSDTMMLMNFDPSTYKINVVSIPRDTKVLIEKKYRKINFAYPHGGIDLTVETVSKLLDVKIKYYVFVDTSAFRKIIDILGGVSLYIPPGMDYDDPTQNLHIHLEPGMKTLDGEQSEQFVRFRHPNFWAKSTKAELMKYYDGSDLKRIEAQQRFINALVEQKLNIQYISRLNSIVDVVFENIETNFSLNELLRLSGSLSKMSLENINFMTLPGKPIDSSPWYYLCDMEEARDMADKYFICEDSFVELDENADEVYDKNYDKVTTSSDDTKSDDESGPVTEPVEEPPIDTTNGNPSNADSSLGGSVAPAP
jgi:LCP family protein required for cell wall assembly